MSKKHYNWEQLQQDYDNGLSYRGLMKKYGIASRSVANAMKRGDIITRTTSEALKMAGPHGCCAWSKEQRSAAAKEQGFGGYNEKAGRSKKFYVKDSYGKTVCLQSSYELLCSELLDELEIKWERPRYLRYDDKKYFPDFLLIEHNIYLDPKNDYLAKIDKEKIDKVCEQNNVKVYILTKDKITKETLLSLAGKTFDR